VQYELYLAGVKALRHRISRDIDEIFTRGQTETWPVFTETFGSTEDIRDGHLLERSLYFLSSLHLNSQGNYEIGGQGVDFLRAVDTATFYNLAQVYVELEQLDKAEVVLSTAIEHARVLKGHESAAIYKIGILNSLGLLRLRKNDLASFEDLLHQALAFDPTAPIVHNNLGCLYSQKGQMDKAREHLNLAISHPSTYPIASRNLQAMQAMQAGGARQSLRYDSIPSFGNPLPKMLDLKKQ
jgi:tetratricopeptide (TPR) repeat protein